MSAVHVYVKGVSVCVNESVSVLCACSYVFLRIVSVGMYVPHEASGLTFLLA